MRSRSAPAIGAPPYLAIGGRTINPVVPTLLGAACISTSAIVTRLADTQAGTTAFYRCILALPILFTLSLLEQRKSGTRPLRQRTMAMVGGMCLGVDLVLWTRAIYDVGAGIATVLANLQVVFVTIIAWGLLRERPKSHFVVALPVVLFGVVLLADLGSSQHSGFHPVAGVLYGLSASVAYAMFIVIFRNSTRGWPHVAGPLTDATVGAAIAALLLGLAVGQMRFSLSGQALGWLILLAVTSQTIGWLLITTSLPRLPVALSSLLLLVQPAASVVLAAIVLSERPSVLQLLGAVLVCGGVLLAARSRSSPDLPAAGPTTGSPPPLQTGGLELE
ncbi:MAG: DMT family transporter [Acidimicrobiales bacterium]